MAVERTADHQYLQTARRVASGLPLTGPLAADAHPLVAKGPSFASTVAHNLARLLGSVNPAGNSQVDGSSPSPAHEVSNFGKGASQK